MKKIRKPVVAGYFYPHSKIELSEEINSLLENNKTTFTAKNIYGLISPHAGYKYSGRTAAYAYNAIKDKKYETVVVISPSHREYFPGICIYDGDAYETPLGVIDVDIELRKQLLKQEKYIFPGQQGHNQEHALEVQLPFLQSVLNDFKLVPVVMGDQNENLVSVLAHKLSTVINEKTLIVASSDLSHFYSRNEANRLDSIVAKKIEEYDYDGLLLALDQRRCEACGGGPIVAMMKACALSRQVKSEVIHRSDSGDASGELREVVGYLSAIIYD